MSINISNATEKNQKMQRVQQELKNLLQHKILNEIPSIREKIEQLLEEVNNVSFKNTNVRHIKGDMHSAEEILEMIKEASSYHKWKFSHSETLTLNEINELKEQFNIDFKEQEITRHMFYRSTQDRNALSTIIVTVVPGYFQVDFHTEKVGYGLDGLVTVKKFKEGVAIETDN